MSEADKPILVIDMISDPVCPWCYIGKRSLDRTSLALSLTHRVLLRYRPYQLAPEIPLKGIARAIYLKRKFPDRTKLDTHKEAIINAAREAGFSLDPRVPDHMPNSLIALQALRYAHEENRQQELAEAIFAAYWQDGKDIGARDTLLEIVSRIEDLNTHELRERIETCSDIDDIKEEVRSFRAGGINGVPTYIINEREGFAGALPPDQLATVIRDLASRAPFHPTGS